jgi:phosphoribosylformimino-5-aminoimidazole carboxamide ribotide isomerase
MDMKVIPAIDIMGGSCVQLVGGKPETRKDYGDPAVRALQWKDAGADIIHLVDLDATLGTGDNIETVLDVKKRSGLPVEFGGGIRSLASARTLLDRLDARDRIIIGTLAVSEYPHFHTLKDLDADKERIIVSVDSKDGFVAVRGWTAKTHHKTREVMEACGDFCWGFLYTNVDVEGQMMGIDEEKMRSIVGATKKPVIISGGISTKKDVDACKKAGAWGVVLGKALYEGKITLKEAQDRSDPTEGRLYQ